jgi:hypothetical protein
VKPDTLLWLLGAAVVITTFAAISLKTLQDYSLRELELYCRRRNKRERYTEILEWHERAVTSAESLQVFGVTLLLAAAFAFVLRQGLDALTWWGGAGFVLLATLAVVLLTVWVAPARGVPHDSNSAD